MASFLFKILLTLLFYLSAPLLALIFTTIAIFRFTASSVVSRCEPGMGRILTSRSSGAGSDEIYDSPKMTLVFISTYAGTIDLPTLQSEFEARVVFARNHSGSLLRPELRQYATRRWGFSFWKDDPFYKISNHVKLYDGSLKEEFSERGRICPEMILRVIEEMIHGSFSPKRSPWELHVFQNYRESPESTESTALALRIHHSLADGFSIINLMKDLLNEIPQKEVQRNGRRGHLGYFLLRPFIFLFLAPYEFISETLNAVDVPTWKVPEVKLSKTINFGISPMIPLEEIKKVCRITNSTFTGVILEGLTGALRRFMVEAGHSVPKEIHCGIPLPTEGHPGRKMRNHVTGCMAALPAGMDDPLGRLRRIEENMLQLRRSTYPVTLFRFIALGGLCFRSLIKPFSANYMTSALMSNLPGPEASTAFNNHPLLSMYFSGGLSRGTCAMAFTALSCAGNIRFVFGLDEALVSAKTLPASQLVTYFLEELEILKNQPKLNISNNQVSLV